MKKHIYLLLLLFLTFSLKAQEKIDNLFQEQILQVNTLEKTTKDFVDNLPSAKLLTIDLSKNTLLLNNKGAYLISIPTKENSTLTIELTPIKITTDDFKVMTPNGEVKVELPTFYRGKIIGQSKSFVSLTVTKEGMEGMIISDKYNLTIGKIKNDKNNIHIIYSTEDIPNHTPFDEGGVIEKLPLGNEVEKKSINTTTAVCMPLVRIYLEADYKMYTDWGSNVTTVTNQMTAIFNQVAILYANETVNIALSGIFVWTSTDPYASATTTSESLGFLNNYWNSLGNNFNGDIVHMVSTKNLGGGVAYLSGGTSVYGGMTSRAVFQSCSKASAKGLSANISNSVSNVPTYSWNVEVIAHELGHNFGLPHTQSCTWPTGAIDNCYTTEGGCAAGPAPTSGGTIMSYCHLISTGINFLNGFGTQPGDKMRAEVAAATCLGSTAPNSPTANGATRNCPGSLTLTATGCSGTYNWYTGPGAGSPIFTGNPYVIASIAASATYWVSCTNTDGCQSGKVPANAVVTPLSDVVTVTPAIRCNTGTLVLSASGCLNTYNWHSASVGGSIVGTGSSFTIPNLSTSTTYYLNCTNGTCSIAARIPVAATVTTLNSLVCAAADVSGTVGSAVFNLGLTNAIGAKLTGNTKTYSTTGLSSYPVINYVNNTLATCQASSWGSSKAVLVPFRVSKTGTYTMSTTGDGYSVFSVFSSNTYNCANLVSGNSYGAIGWYSSRAVTLNECTTYYALLYNLNDSNTTITVSIQGTGDVLEILSNPVGYDFTYVAVNEITGKIDAVSATSNFTTLSAGSYRVYGVNYQTGLNTATFLAQTITQANALGCLMFSNNNRLLTITCASLPSAPTASGGSRCGTGTVSLSATGCAGTYNWYAAATGGASLGTGSPFTTPSIATTTTYYVDCTVSGCISTTRASAVATINGTPSAPTVSGGGCVSAATTLTASGCAGTYHWYLNDINGLDLGTGISLFGVTPGTYYANCTVANCVSAGTTATVTLTPSAPSVADLTILTGQTATLTATGCAGTVNWYASNTETTILFTGASYITPVLTLNTTYFANCTVNGCSSSSRTSAIVTVSTCFSSLPLNSPVDDISTGTVIKQASAMNGTITAQNAITGVGTIVTYQAKSIFLNSGFKADTGTIFKAEIGGCN